MKITLVQRYFWPEAVLTNDIADWLVEAGYDVEVITAQASYHPEAALPKQPRTSTRKQVRIRRIPLFSEKNRGFLRQINGLIFVAQAFLMIVFSRRRSDIYWTTTMPPVTQALVVRIASYLRRAKFIYFLQDIYPEIAVSMNIIRNGRLARLLCALDSWTMNRADAIVPHTTDMADTVRARGVRAKKVALINNFAAITKEFSPRDRRAGPARFIYAGNIGRFQNLERLVRIFAKVAPDIAVLELLGEGREKAALIAIAEREHIDTVQFHKIVPPDEAFDIMSESDVGIVTLAPDLYRYAYPGKTFTYLAAGLPILAMIEPHSELATDIVKRNVGIAVSWSETDERIADAIISLATRKHVFGDTRDRARDMYDPQVARAKWLALFDVVGSAASPT
jgi:colanic acid biosynthesis glycosyl transferase WcaI